MSESLRDRVARVLYEVATAGFTEVPSFEDAHEFDKADHYVAADALIAAGLVTEPEPLQFCVTRYGDRVMYYANSVEEAWGGIRRERERLSSTSLRPRRKVLARRKAGDWIEVPRDVWEGTE